jgi:hypothetical protein
MEKKENTERQGNNYIMNKAEAFLGTRVVASDIV